MKVDWKPFDQTKEETWPENGQVIWASDGSRVCLLVVEVTGTMLPMVSLDPHRVMGSDACSDLDEWNTKFWTPAELPELPQ